MDILSHALAGAATGQMFGRPVLGAAIAVSPDLVLGVARKATPSAGYNATHSVLFTVLSTLAAALLFSPAVAALVGLALLSHLVLDVPTHGKLWGPPLMYPFSARRFSCGNEWEFFNQSWARGFLYTSIWSFICLLLA